MPALNRMRPQAKGDALAPLGEGRQDEYAQKQIEYTRTNTENRPLCFQKTTRSPQTRTVSGAKSPAATIGFSTSRSRTSCIMRNGLIRYQELKKRHRGNYNEKNWYSCMRSNRIAADLV